jgi:hypothetical protein
LQQPQTPQPPTDKDNSESKTTPLISHSHNHRNHTNSGSDSDSNAEDNNWYNPRRTTTQKQPNKKTNSPPTPYRHEPPDTNGRQQAQTQGDQSQRPPAKRKTYTAAISAQTQHPHLSLENIIPRTVIQPMPIEDPTEYSVFNPGHSHVTAKEKRNIRKNETNNDFKGNVLQHKEPDTFRLYFGSENGFNLASKGEPFKELCEDQKLMQSNY